MKKLLSYLFLLVSVVCLAACTAVVSVDSLQVSGQKTGFVLGEEFSTGEMTVIAIFTNGNEEDVTSKVTVTPSTDMSAAGNFSVEVYYEGCTAKYNIVIEKPELVSIEVDHETVAKSYLVGQELSTAGLEVVAHYTNSFTGATQEVVEPTVVVKNAAGEVVEGAFEYVGEYTVSVEFGGLSESFTVSVGNEFASVAEAVAAGIANASKVASGSYDLISFVEDWETGEYSKSVESYTYAFGKNYFTNVGDYGYVYHFELLEDGSIFGVQDAYGVNLYETTGEEMNGVHFSVLYYSFDYYGVEGLVSGLYNIAVEAGLEIFESVEAGVYSFEYNYVIESWSTYYTQIQVEFTLGDGGEISTASYSETIYYSDEVVVAEDGSWTAAEGVVKYPTTYEFKQVMGERVAENPYSTEKVLFTEFDLVTESGEVYAEGAYDLVAGTSNTISLSIGNAQPETAVVSLNEIQLVVTDENGLEISEWYGGLSYSYWDEIISIYGKQQGTYTVTVKCGEIEKSYTYSVTVGNPDWMSVQVEGEWGLIDATGTAGYIDVPSYFQVAFPEYTNNEHSVELKEAYTGVSLTEFGEGYNFIAEKAGTYVVVVKSAVVEDLVQEFTIEVKELPDLSTVLVGSYAYSNPYGGSFTVIFTPNEETEVLSGQVEISIDGAKAVYEYECVNGQLYTTYVSGEYLNCELKFNSSFGLVISYYGWDYNLSPKTVFDDIANSRYVGTISGMEVCVEIYSASYIYYSNPMMGQSTSGTVVENADGTYTITLVDSFFVDNTLILSADFSTVTVQIDMGDGPVEVVLEKPLSSLVAGQRYVVVDEQWNTIASIQFYEQDAYVYCDEVEYYSIVFSVEKAEDGSYTVVFDFAASGAEATIKDSVAVLSTDLSTLTFTTTSGTECVAVLG